MMACPVLTVKMVIGDCRESMAMMALTEMMVPQG
jgi:hypothetical protein